MQTDRVRSIAIPMTSLVLAVMTLCSCGPSSEEVKAAMDQKILRMNQITTAASASFSTILTLEQQYAGSDRTPSRSTLDMFWMALQSTTRDLERMDTLLVENPELVSEARNFWNGRIQENLSKIESSGMLVTLDTPATSKLGEFYGEDRVNKEVERLFATTHSIQDLLGISWTPYTPASPAPPAAP